MSDLDNLSNKRLRKLIHKSEETLNELKAELDRREKESQNHEIDELEQHMESAEVSLKTIRDFLASLSKDLRKD